jgi:hypothetical protein
LFHLFCCSDISVALSGVPPESFSKGDADSKRGKISSEMPETAMATLGLRISS